MLPTMLTKPIDVARRCGGCSEWCKDQKGPKMLLLLTAATMKRLSATR